MKVYYECGPCFLRQAREAMDLATDDEDVKMELMSDIFKFLARFYHKDASSNATGSIIHQMIKEKTNCYDPYINEKKLANEIALSLLPTVENILKKDDSLENHVKVAIVGNLLDFGAFTLDTDVKTLILDLLDKDLIINDIEKFEKDLKNHEKVLYLLDNTGEIVFDKLLLRKIKGYDLDITLAVKDKPILNDACLEDALNVGLDEFGKIVSIGTDTVGFVDSEISDEFRKIFNDSDFIISKGLGNYEGLDEIDLKDKDVYFLFCSKCTAISKDLNVNLKDLVFKKA